MTIVPTGLRGRGLRNGDSATLPKSDRKRVDDDICSAFEVAVDSPEQVQELLTPTPAPPSRKVAPVWACRSGGKPRRALTGLGSEVSEASNGAEWRREVSIG